MREGESVGVVGRNGAGKSTLLRLLSRITQPTEGFCRTRGRVGTLLEVGTGFHPELTGRENVLLNGVILGMSRREVRGRFDEIVEFAGVEAFLDTPLKRYSSGMQLRLAFAVAAHLDPGILIVDEVLAVGDAEFQRRCLGRMTELAGEGRTVIFVSHDLGSVTRLCERAVWLDAGRVRDEGPAGRIVAAYTADLPRSYEAYATPDTDDAHWEVRMRGVAVLGADDQPTGGIRRDEPLVVRIDFESARARPDLDISLWVKNARGVQVLHDSWTDRRAADAGELTAGVNTARIVVPAILAAGTYSLGAWIGTRLEDFVNREYLTFRVLPMPDDTATITDRERTVHPVARWSVGGGAR